MDIITDPPRRVTLKEKVNNLLHKGFKVSDVKKVLKTKERLQNMLPGLVTENLRLS